MKYEKYGNIIASPDKLKFQFVSEGPKGKIVKIIQFAQTSDKDIYNLSFGNLRHDGSVDDETTNDNKDRNKILATVAGAIYEFSSLYPDKFIFFGGTTLERTRLYRMALTININELKKDFLIYGVYKTGDMYERVVFQEQKNYFGFMIKRKKRITLPHEKSQKIKRR